jgi:hypothetical protein
MLYNYMDPHHFRKPDLDSDPQQRDADPKSFEIKKILFVVKVMCHCTTVHTVQPAIHTFCSVTAKKVLSTQSYTTVTILVLTFYDILAEIPEITKMTKINSARTGF